MTFFQHFAAVRSSIRSACGSASSSLRLLVVGTVAVFGLALPSHAFAACTGGSTLNGWYGMYVYGATPSGQLKYRTGAVLFDGNCNIAAADFTIEENNTTYALQYNGGNYNTNSDGTININLDSTWVSAPETYTIGFSPILNQGKGIETDPSAVASVTLKAQSSTNNGTILPYANTSLKGTWVASCAGSPGTFSDLNYFSFDGSTTSSTYSSGFGSLSGIDRSNRGGQPGNNPYTGSYYVFPDGEFVGTLTVSGNIVDFGGIIDNNLNEIQFVYNEALSNNYQAFDACTAVRIK